VLDLGCGDGRLAAEMAGEGVEVVGADRSQAALSRARRLNPGLELVAIDTGGSLPFGDATLDAVLCAHVLEHVVDVQRLLSDVRRALRPGGTFAVAVPWHGRIKNVAIALGWFERHYDPLEPVVRFYTPRSLRRLLEMLGFELLEVRGAGGVPFLRETLLARARRPPL
jgi:SAM-dependent methyltransferase